MSLDHPALGGFLNALGAAFGGYGQDQKNHAAEDDKDEARKAALAKAQQAEDDRRSGLYLKGIRQGTAPDQSKVPEFDTALRQMFSGVMPTGLPGGQGLQNPYDAALQSDPSRFAPDRYQQAGPNQYIDKYSTPEAIEQRKQELAAQLADKRQQAGIAAADTRQHSHETFLQSQQERAQAAADARAASTQAAADNRAIVPVETTAPDGTKTTRYVTKSQAVQDGMSPIARGQQNGTAQAQQARMLAAVSEARLADERMRAFEDALLSGKQNIGIGTQAGGQLMTNLSGSHSVLGALGQAGSEAALNAGNPAYAQYLRDAMTIGRAEQMISPRGGNETMVRANSLLARAGTGASKATIEASRMARQALFGKSGGIAQSMTPQQTEKLEAGLTNVRSGNLAGPSSHAAATHAQALWDAAVAKHGEARVLAEYGPRP